MKTCIEVKNLTVNYSRKVALENVSVSIESGKITGIIGPNGSGKSTFIKSILELVPKSSGAISFFGNSLNAVRSKIAYVPQREQIDWDFPITVQEVVEMGRIQPKKWWKQLTKNDKAIIDNALNQVKMLEYIQQPIGQLSGGQQQRVFLARALAQQAEIYILDEPFVGIDIASQENILTALKQLVAEGKTVLVVHHDLSMVAEHFDDVIILNNKLVAFGSVSSILNKEIIQETYGIKLN